MSELDGLADEVGARLKARGETVAVAESSSGGLISAALYHAYLWPNRQPEADAGSVQPATEADLSAAPAADSTSVATPQVTTPPAASPPAPEP